MEGVISGSHSTESQVMTECECESVLVDFNMDRNRLRLACPLGKAGKKEPLPVSFLTRVATALGIDPFSTGQPSPPREGSPRPHSGVPAPTLRGELGASTWKGF